MILLQPQILKAEGWHKQFIYTKALGDYGQRLLASQTYTVPKFKMKEMLGKYVTIIKMHVSKIHVTKNKKQKTIPPQRN